MAAVDRDVCLELAKLARLHLEEQELEQLSTQLAKIVGYLEQLQAVDVRDVPEYSAALRESPLRPDEIGPSLARERVLEHAPDVRAGHVRVPRFVED